MDFKVDKKCYSKYLDNYIVHPKSNKSRSMWSLLAKELKKMIYGLIPSRLSSSRLQRKALIKIDGMPLVAHTFKRAKMSKLLDEVIVCTDSKKNWRRYKKYGGKFKLTSKKHKNGTERIAEVAKKLKKARLIIDIQGDEPLLNPNDIDDLIRFTKNIKNFDIVVPCIKGSNWTQKILLRFYSIIEVEFYILVVQPFHLILKIRK